MSAESRSLAVLEGGSMRRDSRMDAATRKKIRDRTKMAMADPAVRRKISERTKAAYAERTTDPERVAHDQARTSFRKRFVVGLIAGLLADKVAPPMTKDGEA
jgi:hypothetical protein